LLHSPREPAVAPGPQEQPETATLRDHLRPFPAMAPAPSWSDQAWRSATWTSKTKR
jgi:hypothetical protein